MKSCFNLFASSQTWMTIWLLFDGFVLVGGKTVPVFDSVDKIVIDEVSPDFGGFFLSQLAAFSTRPVVGRADCGPIRCCCSLAALEDRPLSLLIRISLTESCFLMLGKPSCLFPNLLDVLWFNSGDFLFQLMLPLSRYFSNCSLSFVCFIVSKVKLEKIVFKFFSCSSSRNVRVCFLVVVLPLPLLDWDVLNRPKFSLITFSMKADLFFWLLLYRWLLKLLSFVFILSSRTQWVKESGCMKRITT